MAELNAIAANNTANPTDQIEEITSSVTNTNLQDTTKIKAVLTGDVPIPVGANYLEGTVDTGVVIEYKGSQFVWVPIPVTQSNSLYPKGTTKTMARISTAEGYAGTDSKGKTNYEGVLYNYGYRDYGDWYSYNESQVTARGVWRRGSDMYEEPQITKFDDGSVGGLSNPDGPECLEEIGLTVQKFGDEMQENYNAMIYSVMQYGGFFVGRYETVIDNTTTVASKPGTPMSASTDNQRWYGMYDKQKKFSGKNADLTDNNDVMQSSMIWGSQYDAMINWMQAG